MDSFDARAYAAEVVAALCVLGVQARSTSESTVVAQVDIPGDDHWAFLLTPHGWSTLHSRDGVDGELIYGCADRVALDAPPGEAAVAIRSQLASDALAQAVGGVRYLRRCPPD